MNYLHFDICLLKEREKKRKQLDVKRKQNKICQISIQSRVNCQYSKIKKKCSQTKI